MRPIEHRADVTFTQALRCVEYRPMRSSLKPVGAETALGLRYGLIAIAAAHALLLGAPDAEEGPLIRRLGLFSGLVESHVPSIVPSHLASVSDEEACSARIGQRVGEALRAYLPLYRKLYPLDLCLRIVSDDFSVTHRGEITAGWPWLSKRVAEREFRTVADESYHFAMCFFERRQADLEEVPEIALIGE